MELPAPDLLKTGLTFDAEGRQLFFLGAKESEPDRTDIYAISENALMSIASFRPSREISWNRPRRSSMAA